jgi:hypothetical protein
MEYNRLYHHFGWIDRKNHTHTNFLLCFPRGTMFLKFVDALDKVKYENLLFHLLDEIVT